MSLADIRSTPETAAESDPAAGLHPAGDGRMWLDHRYQAALARAGLRAFDDVMGTAQGRCLRVLADRENWHLHLDDQRRPPYGAFLKKHHVRTWSTRLRASLGAAPPPSAGRIEARNVRSLAALGIRVANLVAFGENLCRDGWLQSFLLTEELEGYGELQDFVRRRFRPSAQCGGRPDHELRRLVCQVAGIARRFHAAGYNHRDFYLCHLLIKEPAPGEFDIRLIDLQRAQRRRWFRRRWIVKDLAQLACAVPADRIRCRDKIAFMRYYLGVPKLRPQDKRLIRAVVRKQLRIERRLRRKS